MENGGAAPAQRAAAGMGEVSALRSKLTFSPASHRKRRPDCFPESRFWFRCAYGYPACANVARTCISPQPRSSLAGARARSCGLSCQMMLSLPLCLVSLTGTTLQTPLASQHRSIPWISDARLDALHPHGMGSWRVGQAIFAGHGRTAARGHCQIRSSSASRPGVAALAKRHSLRC